jgi:hypothetical protein
LGIGNNAVFLARYKGHDVAVKVFDVYKDYKYFESEVRAYEHLKDAWGKLVPEPYFICDSREATVCLGMQLGRDPNENDHNAVREKERLLSKLRKDYGFNHLDTDQGNVMYVKGDDKVEQLVAIDLEFHEIMQGKSMD